MATTCNVRHEPGSDAQKSCPVHGRKTSRKVAANLRSFVPSLRSSAPADAVPGLDKVIVEGLLRNRALAGYDRGASIERLTEIASDGEAAPERTGLALMEEEFETSEFEALLTARIIKSSHNIKDLSQQIKMEEDLGSVGPVGPLRLAETLTAVRSRAERGHSVEDSVTALWKIVDSQPRLSEAEIRDALMPEDFFGDEYPAALIARSVSLMRRLEELDAPSSGGE